MLKEFQKFLMRGNVMDLAVGIIIGAAFTAIVNSLVGDIIMPVIGLILNGINFTNIFVVLREGTTAGPYATLKAAQDAGAATLNVGVFIQAVINFVIIGFVVFMLVRTMNNLMDRFKKEEPPAPPPGPTPEEKLTTAIEKLTAVMEKK